MFLFALVSSTITFAQDSKEEEKQKDAQQIENMIQSKNYVFIARSALPMRGRNINLTSIYDLKVSGDTVISDLPYFGRAYSAPINPAEGGIHFTSNDFTYNLTERKKGGWDITILPKDTRDVRQMFLTVSESGYASLQLTSNNRQAISFNGYIKERTNK